MSEQNETTEDTVNPLLELASVFVESAKERLNEKDDNLTEIQKLKKSYNKEMDAIKLGRKDAIKAINESFDAAEKELNNTYTELFKPYRKGLAVVVKKSPVNSVLGAFGAFKKSMSEDK
ncbi:MAG: hypothetical protein KAS32_09680 [Candidatus Peribacteraceae bacterium]|nr:hypothetical protein [Candidatus Peribacteraceae bacterium]